LKVAGRGEKDEAGDVEWMVLTWMLEVGGEMRSF